MANLEGAFRVAVVLKELLKREGRHLLDIIATGGYVDGHAVNTVMSLDLVTMRYTALAPMFTARNGHATVVVDSNLFAIGGSNGDYLSSVECLDLETGEWLEVVPMITARRLHGAAGECGEL